MMSDQTNPLPPVPQHTPPVEEKFGTRRFTNNWMQWFVQLRDKVNSINASLVSLGVVTAQGFLAKLSDGSWASRTFGNTSNITFTNGDGNSGNPSADLTNTGVTPDTYGDSTHVPAFTVDAKGRITEVTSVEIEGGGGGGGGGALSFIGESIVTGAAATSLTISGINLTDSDSYIIQLSLKNNTATAADVSMYFNGDTNAANYNVQLLLSAGVATTSARVTSNATITSIDSSSCTVSDISLIIDSNGNPRSLTKDIRNIPTTPTIRILAHIWEDTAPITEITLTSSVANALAVGSYIRIWKLSNTSSGGGGGALQFVGKAVAASPVTELEVTGLDLNTDGNYRIIGSMYNVSGASATIKLILENDTTATNYWLQFHQFSGSSYSAARGNNNNFTSLEIGSANFFTLDIVKSPDGKVRGICTLTRENTGIQSPRIDIYWTQTINITSIKFQSSVASALSTGSYIKIYKLTDS